MPISVALLFCVPIGFAFYFEGRWLIRPATGRHGLKERGLTVAFAVFGVLLIPSIWCSGLSEDAVSGNFEKEIATAIIVAVTIGISAIAGWFFVTERTEAE